MSEQIFIAERFRRVVILHIVKNLLPNPPQLRVPLILGIHGPSGSGKTFQCEQILREIGAKTFLISGGQLESKEAGTPAQLIRTQYLDASNHLETRQGIAAAVLINDFDAAVGDWGELTQYTINRQQVFGELMHLVDYPNMVQNRRTKRIPIIITGNDFTKLYAPLVRAGRMLSFSWIPTIEEKTGVISNIFPELDKKQCRTLLDAFPQEPLSFFSVLRSSFSDEELYQEIKRYSIRQILEAISKGSELRSESHIRLDRLIQIGRDLISNGAFANHLVRR